MIIAQWNQGTLALAVSSIGLLGAAIATAVGRFNAVNQANEKERIAMVLGECHSRAERQDQKIEKQAQQIGQQVQQIAVLQAQVADMGREIERWKVLSETTNSRMSKGNT